MAKKKKADSMRARAKRYRLALEKDIGFPESQSDWQADLFSAYTQGWMDCLKHVQRLRVRRLKRNH